ncbi:sigma factor-like helix-turn-helix DNA-binding protein [Arenibacter sp. ARW7G5Y1]|uniref:sigma factor-like helix-turn-helix DNA-binding protein n=1 Tax=Arenibacter sp. ARW7G5Y1 TaxID=2135619 RepID=UPI0015E8C0D0
MTGRIAFTFKYGVPTIPGDKHKEIAAQLNISEKAVEKHISRATQSIKKWFKNKKNNLLLVFLIFFH